MVYVLFSFYIVQFAFQTAAVVIVAVVIIQGKSRVPCRKPAECQTRIQEIQA